MVQIYTISRKDFLLFCSNVLSLMGVSVLTFRENGKLREEINYLKKLLEEKLAEINYFKRLLSEKVRHIIVGDLKRMLSKKVRQYSLAMPLTALEPTFRFY